MKRNALRVLIVERDLSVRSFMHLVVNEMSGVAYAGSASSLILAVNLLPSAEADAILVSIESLLKDWNHFRPLSKVLHFWIIGGTKSKLPKDLLGNTKFLAVGDTTQDPQVTANLWSQAIEDGMKPVIPQPLMPQVRGPSNHIVSFVPHLKVEVPKEVLVIASSTGGPQALTAFLSHLRLPVSFPILICQHMSEGYTEDLARALTAECGVPVFEAKDNAEIGKGMVLVAPAGQHFEVIRKGKTILSRLTLDPPEQFVRPAADVLFRTSVGVFGAHVVAVVLTGMGLDGSKGVVAIKTAGGKVIVQDKASSLVYGMPRAVKEACSIDFEGTPQELAGWVRKHFQKV